MLIKRHCVVRLLAGSLVAGVATLPASYAAGPATIAATDGGGSASSDIIAQAAGLNLDAADVRTLIADLPASERGAAGANVSSLEQVIRAELVRRAVLKQAQSPVFEQQPYTRAQLDKVRNAALVRLWVAAQAKVPADYPGEDEIKAAYASNQATLTTPTEYHLAQIFISAPDGGDPVKLAAALKKAADIEGRITPANFSQLAHQLSEHAQSAAKGGDMGYLPGNRMVPQIAAVVRSMHDGSVVGPVKTAQGLHFIELLDKKPGSVPSLAQVHDRLAAALRERRTAELERAYLVSLSDKLGITVDQIQLAKLQQSLPKTDPAL